MSNRQLNFGDIDVDMDLGTRPLFSGTPMSVSPQQSASPQTSRQIGFARCRACMDTGRIGTKYCWCIAGDRAKAQDAGRISEPDQKAKTTRVQALEL